MVSNDAVRYKVLGSRASVVAGDGLDRIQNGSEEVRFVS